MTKTTQSALRRERTMRGWSLQRVADLTGISQSDLSRLERGGLPAFPGWRKRLARAFRADERELFPEVTK
jgi:transcriptional regulator with XRE-family HTH domain